MAIFLLFPARKNIEPQDAKGAAASMYLYILLENPCIEMIILFSDDIKLNCSLILCSM